MQKNFTLSTLALAALVATGLSTAAMAQRGDEMGMGPDLNFDLLDADKDGKITKVEMDAARDARTKAADTNGDGMLSAEELAAMHAKRMAERAALRATKLVEKLDTDGDKMLSPAEMTAGQRDGDMFAKVDADGDGGITKAEADTAREKMKAHGRGRGGKHGKGDRGGPDDDQADPDN